MNGWQWAIIAYFAAQGILTVAIVGKPREPIQPRVAVVTVVTCAVLMYVASRA
jgi:hypothetical protein